MQNLFTLKGKSFRMLQFGPKMLMTLLVIFATLSISKANTYSDEADEAIVLDITGTITDEEGLGLRSSRSQL